VLDYKLLEALAKVVEEGGFERAARVLCITQSAVSQRVKLLEERLGTILLARSTPPRATEAGRLALRHFRMAQRLEGDFEAALGREREGFPSLSVGLNADSLATWFLPAVTPFLTKEGVLLDLSVDDQERTHELLRDGVVLGCVSSRSEPFQGCAATHLGDMEYRVFAAPGFRDRWFPDGLGVEAAGRAPALIFNRKDELHAKLLAGIFGRTPEGFQAFYAPSSEKFAEIIASGLAYGMLPDQQSAALAASGAIVDLAPGHAATVRLFWHRWTLGAGLLDRFTRALVRGARLELHCLGDER
jgi:LysR family transcriptional regulator, chromosome initiation inhibitor